MIRGIMFLAGRLARKWSSVRPLLVAALDVVPVTMAGAIQGDDTRAGKLL